MTDAQIATLRAVRIAAAVLIAAALLWLLHGLPLLIFLPLVGVAAYVVWKVILYEGTWAGWFRIKIREWSTDIRQLMLWASLAFKPKRDQHEVATMVHQQSFLEGRLLSPTNIFTYLPLIIGALGFITIGVDQWRIDRVKHERDAPCSTWELSHDSHNNYHTTRASCAALGASNAALTEWQEALAQERARSNTEVMHVREETAAQIQRAQAAAQRTQALAARQRRRENEGIDAALGGRAPDLERSMCELAGGADCAPAGDSGSGAPAAAGVVSDGSTGADSEPIANTP